MKNKILAGILLLSLLSCSKKEDLEPIKYQGMFKGDVGRNGFHVENTPLQTPVNSKVGQDLELEVVIDGGSGENRPGNFTYNYKLDILLSNISKGKLIESFSDRDESNNKDFNRVKIAVFEKYYSTVVDKIYTAPANKKALKISIDDVHGTVVKGSIKGYLFNTADLKDSILVDANFITD